MELHHRSVLPHDVPRLVDWPRGFAYRTSRHLAKVSKISRYENVLIARSPRLCVPPRVALLFAPFTRAPLVVEISM